LELGFYFWSGGGGFWRGRRILEGAEDFQKDRDIWKTIVLGSEKKKKEKREIKRNKEKKREK
jgi:hypothetical protein